MVLAEFDFNGDIPQPGDKPSVSQGQLLGNNGSNVNIWQVDHIGFNTPGGGYHQQIRMPQKTLPAVITGFGGLYCNSATSAGGAGSSTSLFYTPDATGDIYQLTRHSHTNYVTFGTFTNYNVAKANQFGGWTFLPGGLILQYGKAQVITVGPPSITNVDFPFPFPNALFSVVATRSSSDATATWGITSSGNSGFVLSSSSNNSSANTSWYAIGN